MKSKSIILLLLISALSVRSQSELTLPFMSNIFQTTYLNPSTRSEHAISIGIPAISSVYVQAIHNGFRPNSVFYRENDTLRLSTTSILDNLSEQNMIFANADLDLFHLKLSFYNWDYWLGVRQRHSAGLFYPRDLFRVIIEGNASFNNETIDFGYLGINASIYREYTFGAATHWQNWVFGGRVSLLQGLSNLYLKPSMLQAKVINDMFDHSFASDAVLYSSGIPVDADRMLNTDLFSNTDWLIGYLSRFRNPGVSFALGATYQFDERISFSASVSEIGFIHWSDSTLNYRVKGEATFDGLDILADYLNGNDFDLDSTLVGFRDNFSDEEFEQAYNTWLSPKFYLSANYQLLDRTHVGAQLYTIINRRLYPAITLGCTQGFGSYFAATLTGSFNQKSFTNLGLGLLVKPGPVQIFILVDNYFSPLVDPLSFTNLNFRFGINLVFGRVKTPQGLPYR